MGREKLMPSSSLAMAVASSKPIQIGRVRSPSVSFRMTIGLLVNESTVRPDMTIGLSMFSSVSPSSFFSFSIMLRAFVNTTFFPSTGRGRHLRIRRKGGVRPCVSHPIAVRLRVGAKNVRDERGTGCLFKGNETSPQSRRKRDGECVSEAFSMP